MSEKTKAVITLILLMLTIFNQSLQLMGYSPLPFDSAKVEGVLSSIATAIVGVYAWWKNQNVTRAAREAQRVLDMKKQK